MTDSASAITPQVEEEKDKDRIEVGPIVSKTIPHLKYRPPLVIKLCVLVDQRCAYTHDLVFSE